MNLIEIKNLCLNFSNKRILNNISLQINEKDFISLIGPNGAGKTMLIKSLLKLQPITSGSVKYKKGLKIGYVPQKLTIESTLPIKVIELLKLKENSNNIEQNINKLSEDFKISSILNNELNQISGGQLQKVFLIKALLCNPDLLILDEPEQNLDINSRIDFYELLDLIYKKHNLAIVLSSHELHFVMKRTKKVICLFNHICCSGEPEMVAKDPEFINLFGEKMAKMVSVYRHPEHNHSHPHY